MYFTYGYYLSIECQRIATIYFNHITAYLNMITSTILLRIQPIFEGQHSYFTHISTVFSRPGSLMLMGPGAWLEVARRSESGVHRRTPH